jgi:predicted metal-dependent phosphoesterase TrpH
MRHPSALQPRRPGPQACPPPFPFAPTPLNQTHGRARIRIVGSVEPLFYLDLHSHSTDASDDAGGTVEGYLKWIAGRRKRGYQVDGFVLTEHRGFDPELDYSDLAEQYGVVVLKGAELETEIGHVLVYGVTERFSREFDLSRVDLPSADVFAAARDFGGFAVAAHAGRPRIGIWDYARNGAALAHVRALEELNGGSSAEENERAAELARLRGLFRIGGSDAHYVSAIGRCLTAFRRPVRRIEDLVEALQDGDYWPLRIEDTFRGVE